MIPMAKEIGIPIATTVAIRILISRAIERKTNTNPNIKFEMTVLSLSFTGFELSW